MTRLNATHLAELRHLWPAVEARRAHSEKRLDALIRVAMLRPSRNRRGVPVAVRSWEPYRWPTTLAWVDAPEGPPKQLLRDEVTLEGLDLDGGAFVERVRAAVAA